MKALLALALLVPQFAMASALVIRDNEKLELKVLARLHFYGEAVSEQIASASTEEINRMWNEPKKKVLVYDNSPRPVIFGRPKEESAFKYYTVKFEVDYVVHKERPTVSGSCINNLIEVKYPTGNPNDYTVYKDIGSREGIFYTSSDLGHSTTVAHEFGHGLGLDHPAEDQWAATSPGIMFARYTIVKRQFQIDPNLNPFDKDYLKKPNPKARLNPYTRTVRDEDISAIKWSSIWSDKGNMACLGSGDAILEY